MIERSTIVPRRCRESAICFLTMFFFALPALSC